MFSLQVEAEVFQDWPERHLPDRRYVNTRPPIRGRGGCDAGDVTENGYVSAIEAFLSYFVGD